jgi:hypothetical protein
MAGLRIDATPHPEGFLRGDAPVDLGTDPNHGAPGSAQQPGSAKKESTGKPDCNACPLNNLHNKSFPAW